MKLKPEWEENLRRGVVWVGRHLESLIDRVKKSRAVQKLPKVTPVLSIEGQLPTPKVKELVSHVSLRLLNDMTPPLIDKTTLLIGDGVDVATSMCREKGASTLVEVDFGTTETAPIDPTQSLRIHCQPQRIAVQNNSFDAVIAMLAAPFQGELDLVIQELSRTLVVGGDLLLADFHPFGNYARRGSHRMRASFANGIEDYYRMAQTAGITITDIREGYCDEKSAAFFVTPHEKQLYRQIKGSPLVVVFRGKKLGSVK
ncbi:MAG: hypothetical protein COV45_00455 [Deltaproteobacteria bacterium CG11_big_fil_rev_8_21_14_0_20_47_16]|nr:MAG: hypothetical protein COV45_00455 [Deltaproteobacteria bacterium CG11_big_fil_rev_8_21_14_0_20_47_16]